MAEAATEAVGVELVDLYKHFGPTRALDGFTCSIDQGENLVLLGPSGCGKTTALRALAGLQDIDSGEIRAGGVDLTKLPANKRGMGMVFQQYSLLPHLTARENVEFGLRVRGMGTAERRTVAMNNLELVGLADQAEKYTHQMSGGQQQRVALARALAIKPKVLLLDEPLSALDAKVRVQLREEIRRLQQEFGITSLFVTHDQEEALAIADRVGVMRQGRLEQLAGPTEIYERPVNEFVANFIGSTNRLPGQASGDEAVVLGQRVPLLPGSASGEVTVLVRPEALTLADPGAEDAQTAVVETVSFLGSYSRATVKLGEERLVAQLPPTEATRWQPGDRVAVQVLPVAALAVAAD